jgi:hypothetical protein
LPLRWRQSLWFTCDVRAAPACARRVQAFSWTTEQRDPQTVLRDAVQIAAQRGWHLARGPTTRGRRGVYAVCPLCAAERPDAVPPEGRLVSPAG